MKKKNKHFISKLEEKNIFSLVQLYMKKSEEWNETYMLLIWQKKNQVNWYYFRRIKIHHFFLLKRGHQLQLNIVLKQNFYLEYTLFWNGESKLYQCWWFEYLSDMFQMEKLDASPKYTRPVLKLTCVFASLLFHAIKYYDFSGFWSQQ